MERRLALESKERRQSPQDVGPPLAGVTSRLRSLRFEVEIPVTFVVDARTRPEYLFQVFRACTVVHHKARFARRNSAQCFRRVGEPADVGWVARRAKQGHLIGKYGMGPQAHTIRDEGFDTLVAVV